MSNNNSHVQTVTQKISSSRAISFGINDTAEKSSTSSSPSSTSSHTKQRTTFVKAENDWKYINIGLIRKWTIPRVANLADLEVYINDVVVKPSSRTNDHFVFDFPAMRATWEEYLGETERECRLIALEEACMYAELTAIQHYTLTPRDLVRGALFATEELTIIVRPVWKSRTKSNANKLEIHEEHLVSDIHKTTYNE